MALSQQEHYAIRTSLHGMTASELIDAVGGAEYYLNFFSFKQRNGVALTAEEHHEATYHIETIVIAESMLGYGGWLYRFFRRFRLVNTYFKPR